MSPFGFIRLSRLFFALALVYITSSLYIVLLTVQRVQNELRFHRLYGNDWVAQYEKYEEPVLKSNVMIGVGVAYVIAMCIFLWWAWRRVTAKHAIEPRYRRRRRR